MILKMLGKFCKEQVRMQSTSTMWFQVPIYCSAWPPLQSTRKQSPQSSSPRASGNVCPLTAQEAQNQSINTVPPTPPLLIIPPTLLHHIFPSCIPLWCKTLQSCSEQAIQWTRFPSPNSSFTGRLKCQTSSVRGNDHIHCTWVQLLLCQNCSCQS